jgi:adenylate cyclase
MEHHPGGVLAVVAGDVTDRPGRLDGRPWQQHPHVEVAGDALAERSGREIVGTAGECDAGETCVGTAGLLEDEGAGAGRRFGGLVVGGLGPGVGEVVGSPCESEPGIEQSSVEGVEDRDPFTASRTEFHTGRTQRGDDGSGGSSSDPRRHVGRHPLHARGTETDRPFGAVTCAPHPRRLGHTGAVAVEIERKFLVDVVPVGVAVARSVAMRQGYLAVDRDVTLRLRITDDRAVLTVKAGGSMARTEVEVDLDPADAEALWPSTVGRRIEKVRHDIPIEGGFVAELDVYAGSLDGLLTVEVEFGSIDEAAAFEPPAWFGRDLTGEPGWSNAALSEFGRPDRA